MNVTIQPADLEGSIKVIASKSAAHRLLIAAAFADGPTDILCEELSLDIEATAGALCALGSRISYNEKTGVFHVIPVPEGKAEGKCLLDAGESGSTLRFLLPVICALGKEAKIALHGRLPERPLSPLWEELIRHGCELKRLPDGSIETLGRLKGGEFTIAADVSSQFISGLLFAIPLLEEEAYIRLTGHVESESYIRMTIRALEEFGIRTLWKGDTLKLSAADREAEKARYRTPGRIRVEGDWSNGAFWEVAGMLSSKTIEVKGLDEDSLQGDRAIRRLKKEIAEGNCTVDARDIPDLVPVMSVLAAVSPGTTRFTHAERLRIKESDRIRSTVSMLLSLGAKAKETSDGLIVYGQEKLSGGIVDSCNDHRIAMSAAIASIACEKEVTVLGAEAVRKSYPAFWDDFEKLGGHISLGYRERIT